MTHTSICRSIVAIGSFVFAATIAGAAGAAESPGGNDAVIDQSQSAANKAAMAECNKLPLSERDTCADQAGYGKPTVKAVLTPAQQAAIDRENDAYKRASDACKKMTLSRQTTCMSNAGKDQQLAAKTGR
jgi:hypothetical protein